MHAPCLARFNDLPSLGATQYIYISMEEMQAVAAHIRSKGRTSIAELAQESSSLGLINFEAKAASTGGAGRGGTPLDFDALLA